MAELEILVDYLGGMLSKLSDVERRKLEMSIARKLRTSQKTRITKQQNPDGSAFVPRKFRLANKKNKIKNKMFNAIKNAKYMRVIKSPQGIAVGFTGRVAFIAGIHQYGLKGRVDKDGPTVKYASRELLGFTPEEIKMIEHDIIEHLAAK